MQDFSSFYPCEGQAFKDTMQQLVQSDFYPQLAPILFPEFTPDQLRDQVIASIKDVDEFQSKIMFEVCKYVIRHTMDGFSYDGATSEINTPCLFISNHRDITVDAIMTEYVHISNGLPASHVVIGSNLFEMPLMALLAKANKMFAIPRGGNPREFYNSLLITSQYLHHLVAERQQSAWIAQRNGRTKDGHDKTDPAVLKMIAAHGNRHNPAQTLADMHIVPISLSYEWEPCGILKARETCLRRQGPYQKVPGEDTQSIISGITEFKGHMHMHFCQPLSLQELQDAGSFEVIAQIIDQRIADGYKLYPNNHIASDLLHNTHTSGQYSTEQQSRFMQYLDDACAKYPVDGLRQTLIEMYAAPVK